MIFLFRDLLLVAWLMTRSPAVAECRVKGPGGVTTGRPDSGVVPEHSAIMEVPPPTPLPGGKSDFRGRNAREISGGSIPNSL